MPKEEIVFPENLFRTIDAVHEDATREFGNIDPEAKLLAARRNEANAQKKNTKNDGPSNDSPSKLKI